MSTKIYHAFRCRIENLNSVLRNLEEQLLLASAKHVLKAMSREPPEMNAWSCFEEVMKKGAACTQSQLVWDEDFGCGVFVYLKDEYAYLIPWGYANFVKKPPKSVDYRYWNNTDETEGVSWRSWQARGKTWSDVLDLPSLKFEVVNLASPDAYLHKMKLREVLSKLGAGFSP